MRMRSNNRLRLSVTYEGAIWRTVGAHQPEEEEGNPDKKHAWSDAVT